MGAEYPVFTARGDARSELSELIGEIGAEGDGDSELGLRKVMYVERAGMTVVMVRDRACPLAEALRGRPGWSEPREG